MKVAGKAFGKSLIGKKPSATPYNSLQKYFYSKKKQVYLFGTQYSRIDKAKIGRYTPLRKFKWYGMF